MESKQYVSRVSHKIDELFSLPIGQVQREESFAFANAQSKEVLTQEEHEALTNSMIMESVFL